MSLPKSLRCLVVAAALLAACSPPAPPAPTEAPAAEKPATVTDIQVDNVVADQRLTSPAKITGKAPGTWYFEAVFQAKLIGPDGAVIAEGPAQAKGEWMTTDLVPFVAQLTFSVPADTKATLLLAEDMYGSEDHPDANRVVKIPVVLAATP